MRPVKKIKVIKVHEYVPISYAAAPIILWLCAGLSTYKLWTMFNIFFNQLLADFHFTEIVGCQIR